MHKRVVVTGMGLISPLGRDLDTFWDAIRQSKCAIDRISLFDPERTDAKVAAEIKGFNAEDHWERRDASRMARFSQFAVLASRSAWKHAGLDDFTELDRHRVSTMIGNGIGGIEIDTMGQQKLFAKGPKRIPAMTIPKMIVNEGAGNVAMDLKIYGAAHTLVTACASGSDAIGHALDMIRVGRADVVLTGGTEASITEYAIGGFCSLKALSTNFNDEPKRASRPFDKDRDGFVMGEGAGMLIFESLEHAQRRGATIYAEVGGYGGTADAFHLTAPDPEGDGASRAIKLAIQDAGLKPEDIDYVNAHGTSTPVNDPTETKAIKTAFGEHAYKLKVSSTKGMMGHCIGAAGALETITCIHAIRDGFFPATINHDEPDPACDLDYVPHVGQEGTIRAAVSTSLGFGGHNGAVLVKKFEE